VSYLSLSHSFFSVHRAYDLAVATCYTFGGTLPHLLEVPIHSSHTELNLPQVDKIEFRRPVDIGDLMRLKSRVVYASDDPVRPTAHVEVTCQVIRPER
jgi:acyl-coenzyme A thioesterase 9